MNVDAFLDERPQSETAGDFSQRDENFDALNTKLTPAEETEFQKWKTAYAPKDSGADYDLRGAFKAGLRPDPASGHWPDTFKKPNHPTFSDESKFAADFPEKAGHWEGEKFVGRQSRSAENFSQTEVDRFLDAKPKDDVDRFLDGGGSQSIDAFLDQKPSEEGTLGKIYRVGMTPLVHLPREEGGKVSGGPGTDPTAPMSPENRKAAEAIGEFNPIGNAIKNTGAGFLEFFTSPVGAATAVAGPVLGAIGKGASALAPAARWAGRAIAGGYAVDMGRKVPEAARAMGEASVNGTTQEKLEAALNLGAHIVLPGSLGRSALGPRERAPIIDAPKPELVDDAGKPLVDLSQAKDLNEALKQADAAAGTAPVPVQTFAPPSGKLDLANGEASAATAAPAPVSQLRQAQYPTVEVPLKELKLSEDVPNFKADADAETGVVEGQQLEGDYERLGTGPITVWERNDGTKEVVSGRHRFDLAKRSGEKTIPTQIIKESDGWTKEQVQTLDAEMNIRDGQGTVSDYANYFRNQPMDEAEAADRGLLARAKGQAGWALGKDATDDLYALYRGGKVKEDQAVAIATAAPGEASLQRVGSKAALNGMGPQELRNFIQAVRLKTKAMPAEQLDLFGADDAAMNEAQKLAKVATELQRDLDKEIKSTDNTARNAAAAVKKGIKFERDPQEILQENALLRVKRDEWNNWALKPELVDQVLRKAGVKSPAADRVESFLDGLKIETGGKGAMLEGITGLPVLVWNGSIEVVRKAYRAGKTIAEAAADGLEWIRKNHPGAKFDEAEYLRGITEAAISRVNEGEAQGNAQIHGTEGAAEDRGAAGKDQGAGSIGRDSGQREAGSGEPAPDDDNVSGSGVGQSTFGGDFGPAEESAGPSRVPGERQFPKQVDRSEDVSGQVKQALPPETRSYDVRSNESDAEWARRTIGEQGIGGAIATLKDETNGLPGAQRTALGLSLIKRLGEEERAAAAKGDKQAESAAIEAQVDLVDHVAKRSTDIAQSLQAMSLWARMTLAGHLRAARKVFAAAGQRTIETLKPALDAVREAIEQGNAEAATEVTRAPEVRTAAEDAAAEAIAGSRETHTAVIVEVAGKLGESPEILRQIRERVRDVVHGDERAAQEQKLKNLLGEHYLEVATKPAAARPLTERLKAAGVKNPEGLAKAAESEFKRRAEAEKAKLTARVKKAREVQPLGMLSKETEIDRAIRRQLRQAALRLDTIVKWHYTKVDKAQTTLAARLASGLGLSHDGASYLATRIQQRFQALAAARKRGLLERLGAGTKARLLTRPGLQQRLIEMSNLGAFSEEKYYNAVREKLGLPVFTEEIAREITKRANRLQTLPEGFQQQRATIDLMNYIQRQKGMKWYELPMAFWYANVLSGPMTHLVNVVSNTYNLAAHVALEIAKQPSATPLIMDALGRGVLKGGLEGADVLRSGMVTGTRVGKVDAGRGLELKKFTGWATPLNAWKYVARAMSAEDLVFFKPAEEMRMALAARVIAKQEGLRGVDLAKRTAEILGDTEAARARAEAQAEREGLKGLDYRRRVNEIVEQSRPASAREDARQYALRVTFNNEPTGLLGAVARAVNQVAAKYPLLRAVVPFTNIVANVTNESLNYTPLGFTRTWIGGPEHADAWAKAAVGLAALTGVAALAAQYQRDGNPKFAVSGAGPGSPEQRHQLQQTGWIPYSFKFESRYVSYAQTPLAIPMAILGNYMDALKYKCLDERDALNRVGYALQTSGKVITEQSFLSGVSGLMEYFNRDSTKTIGQTTAGGLAKTASGFVIPNALKQIDQIFDPKVYDAKTVEAALINQVPFARSLNKPSINALGEPVERFLSSRFVSDARERALWNVIARKQAWVPLPNAETIIGKKKDGPGEFRILTPGELYYYTKSSGALIKERLQDDIADLSMMTREEAKAHVQSVAEQARREAKKAFE